MNGNVINRVMESYITEPQEGQYCTETQYVDRRVYYVHKIVDSKTIVLEYLDTKAKNTPGLQFGHQEWEHTHTGIYFTIRFNHGKWKRYNNGKVGDKMNLLFGVDDYYYCWEF